MGYSLAAAPAQPPGDEILRHMAHAYGSATEPDEAAASTVRWLMEATGGEASVRVFLLRSGRLRLAAQEGMLADVGRKRSARRREALDSKRPLLIDVRQPPHHALAILPLVSRGESLGVAELVARRGTLEDRWDLLEAVASQAAILFRNLEVQSGLENRVEALEQAAEFALALVGAESPEDAVGQAVSFCFERFEGPVLGWLDGNGETLDLVALRGVGPARARHLRSKLPTIERWDAMEQAERDLLIDRLAGLLDVPRLAVMDAGESVVMVGGIRNPAGLDVLSRLLEKSLEHVGIVDLARQRNEALDLGIALTAHEVRGPVLGARAVIERLLKAGEVDEGSAEHLEITRRELQELTALVGGLLSWSAGRRSLDLRNVDLVELVREAIESCELQAGTDRVRFDRASGLVVKADRMYLRTGVANIIRNALTYSPAGAEVRVRVGRQNGSALITVADRGPGVPKEERDSIFDPFVRGRASAGRHGRAGLGLFVARRVIEAHRGEIRVAPGDTGSIFRIRLPAGQPS